MSNTMNSIIYGFAIVLAIIHKTHGEITTSDYSEFNVTTESYLESITEKPTLSNVDDGDYFYDVYSDVNKSEETPINYIVEEEEDYGYDNQYYDSYDICTNDVLVATNKVRILSPAQGESVSSMNHWTITPLYRGGSVTVAKRDNVVASDIFSGGCGDLEIFQSELNSTILGTRQWCHEKRLLPCNVSMLMAYHIFGYSSISEPGRGIDVVFTSFDVTYDNPNEEKQSFSMYYYECGGKRLGGEIRSPIFPIEDIPYRGSVICKWELDVGRRADYGIIRFSRFNLPMCEHHHLVIEEDTIIKEKDVTESLLKMLRGSEHTEDNLDKNLIREQTIEKVVNGSQLKALTNNNESFAHHDDSKNAYFYRDSHISAEEAKANPKAGIHVVVITQYCGTDEPERTLYWRRGSKNVTLTFVSENQTLQQYGFVAKFSTFSWKDTMKDHKNFAIATLKPVARSSVPHVIFNYIILIVFVPIGLTIGLGIIIYHIKKRGPTIRDFYKKEKKEMRLRRANTERIKSCSPRVKRPARRAQSLDFSNSRTKDSDAAERGVLVQTQDNRRGSLLNVRFFIANKKSSLKSVFEKNNSLMKINETSDKNSESQ